MSTHKAGVVVGAMVVALVVLAGAGPVRDAEAQEVPESQTGCVRGTFLDYHDQERPGAPPPNYDGPWFRLSQDYPDEYPVEDDYPWLDVPVTSLNTDRGANAYLSALFDYVTEGNVDVDWVVQENQRRQWFHAPWLDASVDGREFIHGLTHELDTAKGLLGPQQDEVRQNWAVGAYNDRGGWAFGQVWCDPMNPDPNRLNPSTDRPNSFPNGMAAFKLLFTTATEEEAPFLEGTMEWEANIFPKPLPPSVSDPNNPNNSSVDPPRVNKTVRLIQMDVSVRDDRLPVGWAFATYVHVSQVTGEPSWNNMVPVGLQWGNDPGVTPAMQQGGTELTSTWINPVLQELPDYTVSHLGWAGRLSGPMDNPASSCMSCHQTSGVPMVPIVPEAAPWFEQTDVPGQLAPDRERLAWFADVPAGVPFSDAQRTSLDYSLQLGIGLQRFYAATCDERALLEQYAGRGPTVDPPAVTVAETCRELSPTIGLAGSGDSSRLIWIVLVAIGLVVGVVLSQLLGRRLGKHADAEPTSHSTRSEESER